MQQKEENCLESYSLKSRNQRQGRRWHCTHSSVIRSQKCMWESQISEKPLFLWVEYMYEWIYQRNVRNGTGSKSRLEEDTSRSYAWLSLSLSRRNSLPTLEWISCCKLCIREAKFVLHENKKRKRIREWRWGRQLRRDKMSVGDRNRVGWSDDHDEE